MDIEWVPAKKNDWMDRRRKTLEVVSKLLPTPSRILEIKFDELSQWSVENKHQYKRADVVDGKLLLDDGPIGDTKFDLIYVGFVLHSLGEYCLPILNSLRRISTRFIVVGEDITSAQHSIEWQERNFKKAPYGIFRSDREWKCIFDLFRLKLQARYVIRRECDIDSNAHRCLYMLRVPTG